MMRSRESPRRLHSSQPHPGTLIAHAVARKTSVPSTSPGSIKFQSSPLYKDMQLSPPTKQNTQNSRLSKSPPAQRPPLTAATAVCLSPGSAPSRVAATVISPKQHWRSTLATGIKWSAPSNNRQSSPQRSPQPSPRAINAGAPLLRQGVRVAHPNGTRGTIRFIGETHFKPGLWVGVELDAPHGKCNGAIQGHEYFSCAPLHGTFVTPSVLQVLGDDDLPSATTEVSKHRQQFPSCSPYGSPKSPRTSSRALPHLAPVTIQVCSTRACPSPLLNVPTPARSTRAQRSPQNSAFPECTGHQHTLQPLPAHTQQYDMPRPELPSAEVISLNERRCGHPTRTEDDEDDSLEGASALQDMYGADWCNPHLYSAVKTKENEQPQQKEPHLSPRIVFSDAAAAAEERPPGQEDEKDALPNCEHQGSSCSNDEETPQAAPVCDSDLDEEIDVAVERRLLCETMQSLHTIAENATARAESAEAQLASRNGTDCLMAMKEGLEAELKSSIETEVKSGTDCLMAMKEGLEAELKAFLETEVKHRVKVMVEEATAELRAVTAEARQLLHAAKPDAESDECLTLPISQIEPMQEDSGSDIHAEAYVEQGEDASGTEQMLSVKAVARQVFESISSDAQISPNESTDDAGSGSGATLNAVSSARSSASNKSDDNEPGPQRSFSVPGLHVHDQQRQEPRRVRDVVSQFEKILPSRSRDQQESSKLAPWPFASTVRAKNFSIAATPWSTAPASSENPRPPRTTSLTALP